MKAGKVSESILKRSVLKTIKFKNDNILAFGNVGNDAIVDAGGYVTASAVAGLLFKEENLFFDCKRAICNAINNVSAEGGKAYGIMVDIVLPEKRLESELREIMRYISGICSQMKLQIAGGNTEVSKAVRSTIVTFTAFGKSVENIQGKLNVKSQMKAFDSIIMTKKIGISGTAALAKEFTEKYEERFQKSYIRKALILEDEMDASFAAEIAMKNDVKMMHDISRGGIYLALWQLAEKSGKGVEVMLDNVHVNQETIELCEIFGINPYKMMSDGAMLMVSEDGDKLVEALRSENVECEIIGKLVDSNDKVFIKNDDRRHIEPPKRDELEIFISSL